MSLIQQPAYLLFIFLLLIVFAEWLAKRNYFRHIGSVIIIIIGAAILPNLQLIPSSENAPPLYNRIFEYAAPLGIFFYLVDIRIKDLKLAGLPMLMMFFIGAAGTLIGVYVSYRILSPQHQVSQAYAVAGMFAGTYIGGGANLNALALQYGVNKNGNLFAAVNAVDNIITTVWILVTMVLPPLLQKMFPRNKKMPPQIKPAAESNLTGFNNEAAAMNITDTALLLALGFGSMFIAYIINSYYPAIPTILTITTVALILAQVPFVQKLKGAKLIGLLMMMLFLAVIGAYCDIRALLQNGEVAVTLLLWDCMLITIHGLFIFIIGGLLKQDWDIVSIASNANVGGATTAPVCAASLGRNELQLPGILAGSVGNALGTYIGFLLAEFLK